MLAIGVLQRFTERGVSVPDEISVVGFDDIFGADFCQPPADHPGGAHRDAGARAVEALVRLTLAPTAGPTPVRVLPTQLVVRGSTGRAPT